jgi:hypothetical protein
MLDIIESTRTLTDTGLKPDQAAAITHVVQQAVERGDHVTPDQFKAGLAELRSEIVSVDKRLSTQISEGRADVARSETRLIRWIVGVVLTAAGIVAGTSVAIGIAILRALTTFASGSQ